MATRKRSIPDPILPIVSPEKGIELLNRLISKGDDLLSHRPVESSSKTEWENIARDYLTRAYGSPSQHLSNVLNAGQYSFNRGGSEGYYEDLRFNGLQRAIKAVVVVIESLKLDIELNSPSKPNETETVQSSEVFIVHGHNDGLKQTVARLLEKLGLQATILHELANEGRTVIEKLVDSSDVGFAVVLLTGDDRGGANTLPFEEQELRARQNVILELGFFLGKLKRHQVCAIYESGVEIPSDYGGVLFIPYDEGGLWKFQLGRELQAANIPVDMNKIVQ